MALGAAATACSRRSSGDPTCASHIAQASLPLGPGVCSQSGFPTAPRLRKALQCGFTAPEDWSGEEKLVPVRESRPVQAPCRERSCVSGAESGPGLEGIHGLEDSRSRKGLGLGPPHTAQLQRGCPASPSHPCPVSAEAVLTLFSALGLDQGQQRSGSRSVHMPQGSFLLCRLPYLHLHLLAFVSKSLHQSHRRAKTFHPSPAQRFHRAC